jgi:L-amino acid N-acyltransferase YncA
MIQKIFSISKDIRYVAVYRDGRLEMKSREAVAEASSPESDRYEELLVNPALITLASQRGNIDCGGLDYLIVRYGRFFQFVLPTEWGHVSVCIERAADPVAIGEQIKREVKANCCVVLKPRLTPSELQASEVLLDIIIDTMQANDWERVREIYLEGLATGQASFETEAPSGNSGMLCTPRTVAWSPATTAAWSPGPPLAQMSRRRCYAGVAEVCLYVEAASQGRGIGMRLLKELVASSDSQGIWTLYGSTFPENAASLQVQSACGFRIVGRRERIAQHHGIWRDTVITERRSRVVGWRGDGHGGSDPRGSAASRALP